MNRKPYERKLRGKTLWYIRWNGKQTWLGRFKEEAYDNWKRLKAGEAVIRPEKVVRVESLTLRQAVDAFLADIAADRQKAEATHKWYKRFLDTLCDHVGNLRFSQLRKDHVKKWIADHPKWSENTAHCAGRAAMALCNWLVKSDAEEFAHIRESPLRGFEKAPSTPRDCDLTPEEYRKIVAVVDDDLRDAIVFMRITGCRPDEMRRVEKRHFDPTIPAIVYPPKEWKCGKRTKVPKDRVIRLPGEALVIIQKRCLKYPTGQIFRGKGDVPIKKDAITRRFKRLSKKLGIPQLVPYSLRHTYATDMAFKVDCLILAELMGTSVKMLEGVYAKARKRQDLMGQAAARALEGFDEVA